MITFEILCIDDLYHAEPLLSEEANLQYGKSESASSRITDTVKEVVIPVLVGVIGVGVSIAALTISIMSAFQGLQQ